MAPVTGESERDPAARDGSASFRHDEIFPKPDRLTGPAATALALGGAEIDLATGRVTSSDGTVTELRPKTAAVLRAMAARPGELFTKDELLEQVWPGLVIEEDGLVQCVGEIRRALGPRGRDSVRTHAKRGYSLQVDPAGPPSGARSAPPRPTGRVAASLAAAILLGGLVLLIRGAWDPPAASSPPSAAVARESPPLAVFPFETPVGASRWRLLGDGVTRDLIADLASNAWLPVLADAATRHAGPPSVDAARRLGAGYLLNGTIEPEGGTVRVDVALADAATGRQIWSRRFEEPAEALPALRRSIAESVAGELAARWTGPIARAEKARFRSGGAGTLAGYELMLRAGDRIAAYTPESMAEAERLLERAVEIEPDLGEAWAKLSLARYNRVDSEMTPEEMETLWALGDAAALEAFRVAPDNPMALGQAANVVRREDPARAEAMTRRAAKLAPNDADVLAYLAFRAAHFPALAPDAVDWIERAIRLNPARPDWYDWNRGMAMFVAGRFGEAASAYARAPEHVEAEAGRLAALALAGDVEAARAGMARLLRERPGFSARWYADLAGLHPDVTAVFNRGFALAGAPPE